MIGKLKALSIYAVFLMAPLLITAQSNTVTTAVPFINIIANAQSMGSGYVGVVASDLYQQNGLDQNPAMLSRGHRIMGHQIISFVPWLRKLVPDINLFESGLYHSIGRNNTVAFTARYFSLGDITFTDNVGNVIGHFRPSEYALSLKYAHCFSEHFSVGGGIKYVRSNLTGGIAVEGQATQVAQALAGDLGFDFRKYIVKHEHFKLHWNVGLAFLNIGNKVSYVVNSTHKDFIPQTMKLGTLFTFRCKIYKNNYVAFDLMYQADKLLVPSPPLFARDSAGNPVPDGNGYYVIEAGKNPDVSPFAGIAQSFADAPGGFKEEMNEIIHQFGTEARISIIDNRLLIATRAGYFNEHSTKGNRKFVTMGWGIGAFGFRFDMAYLLPTQKRHPLENTFAFTLGTRFNLHRDNFFRFKER